MQICKLRILVPPPTAHLYSLNQKLIVASDQVYFYVSSEVNNSIADYYYNYWLQ
jgi:hypothetical protein